MVVLLNFCVFLMQNDTKMSSSASKGAQDIYFLAVYFVIQKYKLDDSTIEEKK